MQKQPTPKNFGVGCFQRQMGYDSGQFLFQELPLNTKILMTSSSLLNAVAGVAALFAPDGLLRLFGASAIDGLAVFVQLTGALYFAFALMNWTAKDSAIGGIYARPVSLGNFGHYFIGALLLARYQFSASFTWPLLVALLVYGGYAGLFYWLVFRATGLPSGTQA
jgi:hypothetical protein